MIREAQEQELSEMLELYLSLHETEVPEMTPQLREIWVSMLRDPKYHVLVNIAEDRIVSSCVCLIVPNLTRGGRPYALVENVVTREGFRGRGYASECLHAAAELAERSGCYKIMLMTGSKEPATLRFYEINGYNSSDKTAFVRWFRN